jgi:hypothetical protein
MCMRNEEKEKIFVNSGKKRYPDLSEETIRM